MVTAAVSGVAILLLLTINRRLRTSKRKEDEFFRFLCIVEIIYCLAEIAASAGRYYAIGQGFKYWPMLLSIIPQIVLVFCVQMWVLFVDYYINGSMDGIKRRYKYFYIPYIVLAVVSVIGIYLIGRVEIEGAEDVTGVSRPIAWMTVSWLGVYFIVSVATVIWYILQAYKIVRVHKAEQDRPLFLKLEVFIIPWILAYVFELIPATAFYIEPLCAAISLFLTFFIIQKRYRYLDEDTQMYNMQFIDFLKKHFKDKGYRDGSFVFIRGGDPQNTAEAIRSCKPENSMAFRLDKDTFLLSSHNPGERALKAFEELLKTEYDAVGGGKSLDISVVVQSKEENYEEFVKRAGL